MVGRVPARRVLQVEHRGTMQNVQVTSTVDEFLRLANLRTAEERVEAWTEVYESAFPAAFATYYPSRGSPARREPAAREAPNLVASMAEREQRALELVVSAADSLTAQHALDDLDFQTVLLVGTSSANGWTARLSGVPTLFLALEMLPEPPFDGVLIHHELMHISHDQRARIDGWPESVAGSLFCEGLATAASRRLVTGLSDSAYLWFDDNHAPWVSECADQSKRIRAMARSELDSTTDAIVATLFSARPSSPLPTRCGYWLGDQLFHAALQSGHSLDHLARLTYDEACEFLVSPSVWGLRH